MKCGSPTHSSYLPALHLVLGLSGGSSGEEVCAETSFPFVYMGFWHGWAMFAPEPIHVPRS
ncbi:MAG: hypothetical protein WKF77_09090 [Planctomycetaceae bacterium]